MLLSDFFRDRITPAAERLRARGVEWFPLSADGSAQTYYGTRSSGGDYIDEIKSGDIETRLQALWADVPELAELIPDLLRLSARLATTDDDVKEVPAFVYAMF